MKNYNANDIGIALKDVEIEKSDIVMMHSSPLSLGRFDGKNMAQEIIAAILEYLGEDGTLITPAFNFDFCKGMAFDRQNSPSKNMGVLSETVRQLPNAERSVHPMQSVAAVGKLAKEICEKDTPSALSIGGSFDFLLKQNAKLLLFGANFNAASFAHYAEERLEVPYRFFKTFKSEYIDKGKSEIREYQMFVRDLELNPELTLLDLQAKMEGEGKVRRAKLGLGEIISCNFKDLYNSAYKMLEKDKFAFLKNKEEVLAKLEERSVNE